MKLTIGGKRAGNWGKSTLRGLAAAFCLGSAINASAVVNDPDYFNLYPIIQGGDATSVAVCGVAGCAAPAAMLVSTISITPAGSGVRDTFLRVQAPGNNTIETAYNTELYPLQDNVAYRNGAKDTNAGNKDTFNNAVLIGDLLKINVGGVDYFQILLDVNENGGHDGEFIRLDEFEIHTSTTGFVGGFPGFGGTASGSFAIDSDSGTGTGSIAPRKVFDMDYWSPPSPAGNANGGLILSSRQDGKSRNGSGDEDYSFLIPVSLFNPDDVYLHVAATFGCEVISNNAKGDKGQCVGYDSNDPLARAQAGFEEFAAVLGRNPKGDSDVPVPGTALLLGLGILILYRRRHASHEIPPSITG